MTRYSCSTTHGVIQLDKTACVVVKHAGGKVELWVDGKKVSENQINQPVSQTPLSGMEVWVTPELEMFQCFMLKDGLQCAVVRRLVRDLSLPTDVVICPTVREADGLAMSTRSQHLTEVGRGDLFII